MESARENLAIIKQGAISRIEAGWLTREVRANVLELEKTLGSGVFAEKDQAGAECEFAKFKRDLGGSLRIDQGAAKKMRGKLFDIHAVSQIA